MKQKIHLEKVDTILGLDHVTFVRGQKPMNPDMPPGVSECGGKIIFQPAKVRKALRDDLKRKTVRVRSVLP